MRQFVFTNVAKKRFLSLSQSTQDRIKKKLSSLKTVPDEQLPLRRLRHLEPATHRIMVGSYRIIVKKESTAKYIVLDVGHRKDIYTTSI